MYGAGIDPIFPSRPSSSLIGSSWQSRNCEPASTISVPSERSPPESACSLPFQPGWRTTRRARGTSEHLQLGGASTILGITSEKIGRYQFPHCVNVERAIPVMLDSRTVFTIRSSRGTARPERDSEQSNHRTHGQSGGNFSERHDQIPLIVAHRPNIERLDVRAGSHLVD
jgi:hypothetical protein